MLEYQNARQKYLQSDIRIAGFSAMKIGALIMVSFIEPERNIFKEVEISKLYAILQDLSEKYITQQKIKKYNKSALFQRT